MTLVRDFGQSLRQVAEIVGRLVDSTREQNKALVNGDLPGIETSRLRQEELLGELNGAQVSCRACLARLKESMHLPEEETVAGLLAGRPELAAAAGQWQELLADLGRLRDMTQTNRLLAIRAVQFYRKVTGIIQPERQDIYADSGRLRARNAPVISRFA